VALTKVNRGGLNTGISDSSDANAITIDSSENVLIGDASPQVTSKLTVSGNGSADTATFMYDGTAGTYLDINTNTANGIISLEANARSGNYPPLTFITSGSERLRIQAGGGISFNGDTAAANALSDFETGSWNPSVGGNATYTTQKGIYTKIGNIVTVHFDIEINAIGTGTTNRITNFPFTNSANFPASGGVSFFSGINSSNTFIGMYVIDGTTECNFTGGTGNATTISQNGFAIFGNSARVIGSVVYRAA